MRKKISSFDTVYSPNQTKIKKQSRKITAIAAICVALCLIMSSFFLVYIFVSKDDAGDYFGNRQTEEFMTDQISNYYTPYQVTRTDGLEAIRCPYATVIKMVDELEEYCNNQADFFDFGSNQTAGSFTQIAQSYGESFFVDHLLVLAVIDGDPNDFCPFDIYLDGSDCIVIEMNNVKKADKGSTHYGHIFIELSKEEFPSDSAKIILK